MRYENEFKERLERGDVVLGGRVSTFAPELIELYGTLAFNFVWLDFEHGGPSLWDSFTLEELARTAEVANIQLLVRVPLDQSLIRKVLDAGIRNVLIPRIDTADEVARAVKASQFVHDGEPGERGFSAGRSSNYGNTSENTAREDDSVSVGVMIEKRTAVENLDDIVSVPGLAFVFVGPSDLSVQLGVPGDTTCSTVQEAIAKIESACKESSTPLGGIGHDPGSAYDLIQRGYRIIRLGGELEATRQCLGRRLDRLDALLDEM